MTKRIENVLLLSRNSEFNQKARHAMHHFGVTRLNEFPEILEARLAFDIKDYHLAIFRINTEHGEAFRTDLMDFLKVCETHKVPAVVVCAKALDIEKFPDFAIRVDASVSEREFINQVAGLLKVRAPSLHIPDKVQSILKGLKFFHDLSSGALEILISLGSLKSFDKGTLVFKKGSHGNYFCIIIQGTVNVALEADNVVACLSSGDCFGEMALISPHEEGREVSISSVTDGKIFVLPHGFLNELTEKQRLEVYHCIMVALIDKLKKTTSLLMEK